MDELNAIVSLWGKPCTKDADGTVLIEGRALTAQESAAVQAEIIRLEAEAKATEYRRLRAKEYPPMADYLDAIVKGDEAQKQAYIDACLAVKTKYPKGAA